MIVWLKFGDDQHNSMDSMKHVRVIDTNIHTAWNEYLKIDCNFCNLENLVMDETHKKITIARDIGMMITAMTLVT